MLGFILKLVGVNVWKMARSLNLSLFIHMSAAKQRGCV